MSNFDTSHLALPHPDESSRLARPRDSCYMLLCIMEEKYVWEKCVSATFCKLRFEEYPGLLSRILYNKDSCETLNALWRWNVLYDDRHTTHPSIYRYEVYSVLCLAAKAGIPATLWRRCEKCVLRCFTAWCLSYINITLHTKRALSYCRELIHQSSFINESLFVVAVFIQDMAQKMLYVHDKRRVTKPPHPTHRYTHNDTHTLSLYH